MVLISVKPIGSHYREESSIDSDNLFHVMYSRLHRTY